MEDGSQQRKYVCVKVREWKKESHARQSASRWERFQRGFSSLHLVCPNQEYGHHAGDLMTTVALDSQYGRNSVKEGESRVYEVMRWEDVEAKTCGSLRAVLQVLNFILSVMKLHLV